MRYNDWSGHTFAHPRGRVPWAGDALTADANSPMQGIMRQGGGLGPIFELQIFKQKFVFVSGAMLAAELCDEARFCKALPPSLTALREIAGAGLFTAYNDETDWALAHDLLRPAFTRDAMRGYHPIMLGALTELMSAWERTSGPVDVSADMTRLTLETISRTAFSQDFGSFTSDEPHPFIPAMVAALKGGQRKGNLASIPGARLIRKRIESSFVQHQAYIDGLLDDLIAARRAGGAVQHDDLMGLMLHSAHPETGMSIDDVNIRHQILTFLVAGHETTSGALSFALFYLTRSPEAMAQASAEVDRVMGEDRDALPTFEQVPKFRYLRRVLDETLRLWPTAPAFARSPRQTTTLSTGQVMTPDDWAIVALPMTHRDPSVWGDDAEQFDPDRFSPERSRQRPAHVYKPFGTGERACIGRQFAVHEAILVLATVLHRFRFTHDPSYELAVSERLTLMPKGFSLQVEAR